MTGRLVADAVPGGARYVPLAADIPPGPSPRSPRPGDPGADHGRGRRHQARPADPRGDRRRCPLTTRTRRVPGGCPRGEDGGAARRSERQRAWRRAIRRHRGGPEVRGALPGEPDVAASKPGDRGGREVGAYPPGKKWRAAFFVLASVGILAAIAWALLGDRLLVVRVITVSGTRLVTPAQVREAADVPAGTPLIRVDTAQVAARVETITQVASVRVSKDWPDGLSITVTERVPVVAVRMAGGGYDLVDHDGVIVTYQRAKPAALPLLQTALPVGQLHGNPDVATASAVLAELPPWLHREVAKVAVTSGGVRQRQWRHVEEADVPKPATGGPASSTRARPSCGAAPGHGPDEGKRACYPDARSGELLRRKRPADRRHPVTGRFRAGACSRHIEEVRAWLVDPGAQPPYCPYQS